MARRIEHRSTTAWSADRVHEALIDADYLRERLHELGGERAAIVEHAITEDGVRFQLRHGISADTLPAVARSVVGEDLTIDRSESWRRAEPGYYVGEIAAEVNGVPCSITGSMWLSDLPEPTPEAASEFTVSGTVRVSVPLFGGKLESLAAEQVQKLLAAEERFTNEWLERRT